jgi:DNA-binding IclR family transcriptional regulator
VHVGQLVGAWVVYLHREAGPVRAPMDNRVGLRAPAWRGGCGKAALSRLPPDEVDERIARLCREEGVTAPDAPALHAELALARRDGWLVSSSFQPGRTSVAAPVVRAAREPVGGLSVAGPSALFPPAVVRRLGPEVAAAARHAGQALG